MRLSTGARAGWGVLSAVALLAAAAAATVTAPTQDDVQAPIESVGPVGRTIVARQIEARAEAVRVADRLALPAGSSSRDSATDGVWVVVDLTVACRIDACGFAGSRLRIAGRSYAPSAIVPGASFATTSQDPGLRYRTSAVFEVPRSALRAGSARLAVQPEETRNLDGVPVVALRLPRTAAAIAPVRSTVLVGAVS